MSRKNRPRTPVFSSNSRRNRHSLSLPRPVRDAEIDQKAEPSTTVGAEAPSSHLLLLQHNRELTYNIPLSPFYGTIPTSQPPPHCSLDPRSTDCRIPTLPPQQPVPAHPVATTAAARRHVILSTCTGGIIMLSIVLAMYYFVRKTRQIALEHQHEEEIQQQRPTRPSSSREQAATDTIPEVVRRSQMEGKLKLVRPDDIILEEGDSCIICLNDFSAEGQISGSLNPLCRHYFHTECILQAFLQRPKACYECPVCRRDYFDVSSTT